MREMIVERVARAIADADYNSMDAGPASRAAFMRMARAAIAAMRDPTPEMVEAGRFPAEDDSPVACWQAMIDATLPAEGCDSAAAAQSSSETDHV